MNHENTKVRKHEKIRRDKDDQMSEMWGEI